MEVQQERAVRARWKATEPSKRIAAAKRQAAARWGTKVTLDFGRNWPQTIGYLKHSKGEFGSSYRLKGDQEWHSTPNGDLIGDVFYVYGRR